MSRGAADPARQRAERLLDELAGASRGEIKRRGEALDAAGDRALRRALIAAGRSRGAVLPDEAVDWPAKRLLRVARGLEDESRERSNPIARDEAFTCAHCGAEVPPHGRTARDHCPWCLRSVHVDVVPGDRAAGCGGIMDPVGVDMTGGTPTLRYRCRRCGAEQRNRAVLDGEVPDDWEAIAAASVQEPP